jgi:hypothetical protein
VSTVSFDCSVAFAAMKYGVFTPSGIAALHCRCSGETALQADGGAHRTVHILCSLTALFKCPACFIAR